VPRATIDRLIVNSPYEEPTRHWRYDRTTHLVDLADGRRPAGYVVASGRESGAFDDPGVFRETPWSTEFERGSRRGVPLATPA
jgi:type III restriction enzyme